MHPGKLLQEIFLKIKLRKLLQKCPIQEKIVISISAIIKFDLQRFKRV